MAELRPGLVEHLLGHGDGRAVEAHSQRYEALRDQVTAFPGTADLVRACADRGYVPVLATSGKQDDEWMLPAIDQHRLDPDRSVVVGDTVWDVKAALKAGLPCIGLTCGGISGAELCEAGAGEVYDDPADLLENLEASLLGRLTG